MRCKRGPNARRGIQESFSNYTVIVRKSPHPSVGHSLYLQNGGPAPGPNSRVSPAGGKCVKRKYFDPVIFGGEKKERKKEYE